MTNPILEAFGVAKRVEESELGELCLYLDGRPVASIVPYSKSRGTFEALYHLDHAGQPVGSAFSCCYGRQDAHAVKLRLAQFLAGTRPLRRGEIKQYRDQVERLKIAAFKIGDTPLSSALWLN